LFINVPRRIDFETIPMETAIELIDAKVEKEANRYIHRWDSEKITVENGRWGPFIRFKKKSIKLPKKEDGSRMTSDDALLLSLEDVKKFIEAEVPGAFAKKTKAKAKPKAKAKKK
ncbi:MAG: topoisomerase C-terminal repeat-containing protein, partial [Bacteroidota bacterium]